MPAHWNALDGPCPLCASEPGPHDDLHLILHLDRDAASGGHWCAWCAQPTVTVTPVRTTCEHGWPSRGLEVPPVAYCDAHEDVVPLPAHAA